MGLEDLDIRNPEDLHKLYIEAFRNLNLKHLKELFLSREDETTEKLKDLLETSMKCERCAKNRVTRIDKMRLVGGIGTAAIGYLFLPETLIATLPLTAYAAGDSISTYRKFNKTCRNLERLYKKLLTYLPKDPDIGEEK
jgi:hypothetical protein